MFSAKTYAARRQTLRTKIGQGLILLPGNTLAPNNYPNNAYYFRQDSSFLYFFGLNTPSLVGLIDTDSGDEALYGDDFTVEDIIWTGPQPSLRELGAQIGVSETHPLAALEARLPPLSRIRNSYPKSLTTAKINQFINMTTKKTGKPLVNRKK